MTQMTSLKMKSLKKKIRSKKCTCNLTKMRDLLDEFLANLDNSDSISEIRMHKNPNNKQFKPLKKKAQM
jgi:hypothetical protein